MDAEIGFSWFLFDERGIASRAGYLPDDFLLATHYMNAAMMRKCWDVFAKFYFGADTPKNLATVDVQVKPYVLFPILDFEHLLAESKNLKYLEMNFQVTKKDLGF